MLVSAVPGAWEAFYKSDLQGAWAVSLPPLLFLVWRLMAGRPAAGGIDPRIAGFIETWARVFAIETLIDPWATGPWLRWVGWADGPIATVVLASFVLLGDFRVFLLVFRVADPAAPWQRIVRLAGAWTLVVPLIALPTTWALGRLVDPLHGMTIWIVYESAFMGLALGLRGLARDVRSPELRAYLRALLTYVALYYGLWAFADACIIFGGYDAGWAIRVLPNQLYYAWWVPFVWWRFFASSKLATRTSVQM